MNLSGFFSELRRRRVFRAAVKRLLRERGRVAALVGDTATAVHAYRYYVALRAEADPRLHAEVERVRAEL